MSAYLRTINKRGRRRRNERFWGWGLNTDWRRRSSRKRRVILHRRRDGASERKGGGDKGRGDDVGNIHSELADTLEGDYEVVRVLEDDELDSDDLRVFSWRVVRD
jgi:hypothetical protein